MIDSPDPVTVGASLTYTLMITNAGPDSADAVQVIDTLPSGVAFVSSALTQGSCIGTTTVVCSLGTIASTATATVTIIGQPTAPGTLTNTANVTAATVDPNAANNAASQPTAVNPAPPPPPPPGPNCHPSYPDVCIPPPPPDLDCSQITHRNFRVIYTVPDPDPHRFDGDRDGIGCET